MPTPRRWPVRMIARKLGLPPSYIRKAIKEGRLAAVCLPGVGYMARPEAVAAFAYREIRACSDAASLMLDSLGSIIEDMGEIENA